MQFFFVVTSHLAKIGLDDNAKTAFLFLSTVQFGEIAGNYERGSVWAPGWGKKLFYEALFTV